MSHSHDKSRVFDVIGIWGSAICLVHCLATPILLILLPSLGVLFQGPLFHTILATVLPIVAALAFVPGYRRHGDLSVIFMGTLGTALIVFAVVEYHSHERAEQLITMAGGTLLIIAHLRNRARLKAQAQQ